MHYRFTINIGIPQSKVECMPAKEVTAQPGSFKVDYIT